VEHDEVGPELRHRGEGGPPPVAHLDLEALVAKAHGEKLADVLLVIHHQDAAWSVHVQSVGSLPQNHLRARCEMQQCHTALLPPDERPLKRCGDSVELRCSLSEPSEVLARPLVPVEEPQDIRERAHDVSDTATTGPPDRPTPP